MHEGQLTIQNDAPHGARFFNRFGQDIRQQRTLEVAFWLDHWCEWQGEEDDGRFFRSRHALQREAA